MTARGDVEQAGERRLAPVESLRAIAALGVVAGHVYAFRVNFGPSLYDSFGHRALFGLVMGVWIFFALTGFLLFRPFARRFFADGPPVRVSTYLRNRALRLLPLYYVVLVVFMITEAGGGTWGQWLRFALLAENFSTRTVSTVDGPMWSLVVEAHFSLLLPLLAYGLARLTGGSRLRAAAVLCALAAGAFYLRRGAVTAAPFDARLAYSLPATFGYFVPGMLLALWDPLRPPARWPAWARRADVWLVLALVPLVVTWADYSLDPLVALTGLLAVGACVLPLDAGPLLRALSSRPLAVLGIASYSLYLWHFPVVGHLGDASGAPQGYPGRLVLALVVLVPVALVSYALVERPFLRARRPWSEAALATPGSP